MDEALGLLEGELGSGQRALDDLVTEDLWLAFLRFGRRLFDVPDTPDAAGVVDVQAECGRHRGSVFAAGLVRGAVGGPHGDQLQGAGGLDRGGRGVVFITS